MNRRQFLKLLGAVPLALGLRLPIAAKTKSESAWGNDLNGKTIYVSGRWGDDANDGLSPQSAKRSISAALDMADAADEVYVYPGIYHEENKSLQPKASFYMVDSSVHLGPDGRLDLTQAHHSYIVDNFFLG